MGELLNCFLYPLCMPLKRSSPWPENFLSYLPYPKNFSPHLSVIKMEPSSPHAAHQDRPDPMITPLPLRLCPSHFLGGGRIAAPPVSPRSPVLSPRHPTAVHYSATAVDLPSPLLTPPTPSLYDILGVSNEATPQEIKAAYRRLARSCHPDTAASGSNEGASADEFMRIHAAYVTLSDPDKRTDYNRKMVVIRRQRPPVAYSAASSPPFAGGYARRSWETDQCW